MPKSTQDIQADFTSVQARQAWSLGLCAGNGVQYLNPTSCSSFPPPIAPILNPKAPLEPGKNQALQWCAQIGKQCGGCKVMP